MKLTKISAKDVQIIKQDVQQALETIGLKYGLSIELQKTAYNSSIIEVKATFKTNEGDQKQIDQINRAFATFGLKAGDRIRSSKNGVLVISGYNSRAHQYPVKLKTLDGKGIKATIDFCVSNLIK